MSTRILRASVAAAAAAIVAVVLATGRAAAQGGGEAKMYVTTTWNASCSGNSLSWWDDMVDAWYDEITFFGAIGPFGCMFGHCNSAFAADGAAIDGQIVNSLFADSSVVSWGNDSANLDDGDAVMFGGHGADSGGVWQGSMRVDESGSGNCQLRRDEMDIGDMDLEYLHLSSCNSMDRNQWSTWWQAFDGAHQVTGFHGFMWIGASLVGDYRSFADRAFDIALGDSWLDEMFYDDVDGNGTMQCPVAYAVGKNSQDTWNRLGSEQYDNTLSDPTSVGYWGVIYIGGCDPQGEGNIDG